MSLVEPIEVPGALAVTQSDCHAVSSVGLLPRDDSATDVLSLVAFFIRLTVYIIVPLPDLSRRENYYCHNVLFRESYSRVLSLKICCRAAQPRSGRQ
jgi:hypothetical protein